MSAYQDRLTEDIKQNKIKILPESRRNEVLGFLEHNKLTDLSVSRPKSRLAWGIPIPFDTNHVTYVWFDALVNYISACGYGRDEVMFKKWWPANVHIIGKDIIRHHAVIWPTLLYALGLELPQLIFAHGWWLQSGDKMSKSKGNVTDPTALVQKYGVDAIRYFLLRETAFGQDGTFSEDAVVQRYNTDLANNLGNLLSRSLTMCEKYFDGTIPVLDPNFKSWSPQRSESQPVLEGYERLRALIEELPIKIKQSMTILAFDQALAQVWALVDQANKYIEETAPWKLAKESKKDEIKIVIAVLIDVLRALSQHLEPFIPSTAQNIRAQLGDGKKVAKGTALK
jgi:methionyl-tRNA synthetase